MYRVIRDHVTKQITVLPTKQPKTAVVILMHGLGDSPEGFADVAEMWAKKLPYVKFVLPAAPNSPVTMNMGMVMPSWYDIHGLSDRASEACDGIDESSERIRGLLDTEHAEGVPYSRMMLAGFSQGGAMSLFTGLQLPAEKGVGGILCMSGYLAGASKFKLTPGLESTPVLHCHGTQDPMVIYPWAEKTRKTIMDAGLNDYTLKSFPMQHTVIMEELEMAVDFIRTTLPDSATAGEQKEVEPSPEPREMSIKQLKMALARAGLTAQTKGLVEKIEFIKLLEQHLASN